MAKRIKFNRKWGLSLGFYRTNDESGIHFLPVFGEWFIPLPSRFHVQPKDFYDSWGFSWKWGRDQLQNPIYLNWGHRCRILLMPWDWYFIRKDFLMADGTWKREQKGEWKDPDGAFKETHDYTYVLKNGNVQNRTATITVDEMEWRWRWFKWLPWPRKVRRSIDVKFSDEVGERTGSWKGGCVGCGCEMLPNENPEMTLRRMEEERRFD